jgi:hypothetical protein
VFPGRLSECSITDESGPAVNAEDMVVVLSHDEELGPTESTSTLLANATLRREYEELHDELEAVVNDLLDALGKQAQLAGDPVRRRQHVISIIPPGSRDSDKRFHEALAAICGVVRPDRLVLSTQTAERRMRRMRTYRRFWLTLFATLRSHRDRSGCPGSRLVTWPRRLQGSLTLN